MNINYMKGELLQLKTKNDDVFVGRFQSYNSDKSRISLYGVKVDGQDIQCENVCHYYDREVDSINKLKETEDLSNQVKKLLRISQKEVEDIVIVSKRYSFINQVDVSFHEALKDLNNCSYVALSTDGASMGRKCKMPFIVLSTPEQIYIFDIQVMQYKAFDGGLKMLLESESPKKIVHDCRKLSDSLFHKHNVTIKSVFDTQVGDIIIMKNKTGVLPKNVKKLQDCLNYYIGLPSNVIDDKLDLLKCNERPLSTAIKETLAKNIAYLHRLSEIINDEMALPFIRGVECYLNNIRPTDDHKAWELCGKLEQIPKEFLSSIEY